MKRVVCFMMSFLLLVMSVPMEGLAGSVSGNEGVGEKVDAETKNTVSQNGISGDVFATDDKADEGVKDCDEDIVESQSLEKAAESLCTIDLDLFSYVINSKEKTAAISGILDNTVTDLVVPGKITYENIIYTVTEIQEEAFFENGVIENVVIGEGIEYIGIDAFAKCKNLKTVNLPSTISVLDWYAFGLCDALTSINIPSNITTSNMPFTECSNLTDITFEEGISKISDRLFAECTGIEVIVIPKSVTHIGAGAFYDCINLREIQFSDSICKIENAAFACTSLSQLNLPDSIEELGDSAFSRCISLESVDLPKNIKIIGNRAFSDCVKLDNIEIPKSLTSADSIFEGCSNLKNITFEEGITRIPYGLFAEFDYLTSFCVPETVTVIDAQAFWECENLTYVECNDNIVDIGRGAFAHTQITEFTIPEKMTEIKEYLFYCCASLEKVKIPDSVTVIGDGAFQWCKELEEINVPKNLIDIGDDAFWACRKVESFILPDTIETIGESAFLGCESITQIEVPENVTVIEKDTFSGCDSLTTITLPDKVEEIKERAFNGCISLEVINIPSNVETISCAMFRGCTALKSVSLPTGLKSIEEEAFSECTNLENCNLSDEIEEIGEFAFENCSSLKEISIPKAMTRIERCCFDGCSSLSSVKIPNNIKSIERGAFAQCTQLESLYIPNSVKYIESILGDDIYEGDEKLTIYCSQNSCAVISAIASGVNFVYDESLYDESVDLLEREKTDFELNSSFNYSTGYLDINLNYEIKQERSDVENDSIIFLVPDNCEINNIVNAENKPLDVYYFRDSIGASEDDLNAVDISLINSTDNIKITLKVATQNIKTFAYLCQDVYYYDDNYEGIGVIDETVPLISIEADTCVAGTTVPVQGLVSPSGIVNLYVDGELQKTVQANKVGRYNAEVKLDAPAVNTTHVIKATTTYGDEVLEAYKKIKYCEKTLQLEKFDMYYTNTQGTNKIDLLNESSTTVAFDSNEPLSFEIGVSNAEVADEIYVVSTKSGRSEKMKAEWDSEKKSYIASGFFEGKKYVPGQLSVEYVNKYDTKTMPEVQDINFQNEEFQNGIEEIFGDSTIVTEKNDESEFVSTITLGNAVSDLAEAELKMTIKTIATQYAPDFTGTLEGYDEALSFVSTLADGKEYWINQDWLDEKTYMAIIHDVTGSKMYNVILEVVSDSKNATDIKVSQVMEEIGALGSVCGYLNDYLTIQDEYEELNGQINMLGLSEEERQIALQKSKDLKSDKEKLLCMTMLFAAMGVTAGATAPALVFSLLLGSLTASSSFFFELRAANIISVGSNDVSLVRFCIDPSGYVYSGVMSNRIEGVKATIYYRETLESESVLWDAEEYSQSNPLYTTSDGCYAWDVPEGYWQVKFEKEGYRTQYTEWLEVPPPQTDININLVPEVAPEINTAVFHSGYLYLKMSDYVKSSTISNVLLTDESDNNIQYTVEPLDSDEEYACEFKLIFTNSVVDGENLKILVNGSVKGVGEQAVKTQEYTATKNKEPKLIVPQNVSIQYGSELEIPIEVLDFSTNEKLTCKIKNTNIVELSPNTYNITGNGKIQIKLKGKMFGTTMLYLSIEGTEISQEVNITVGDESSIGKMKKMIVFEKEVYSVSQGDIIEIAPIIYPADSSISGLWSSSDESVVINEVGTNKFKAVKTGFSILKYTIEDGTYAECSVLVRNLAEKEDPSKDNNVNGKLDEGVNQSTNGTANNQNGTGQNSGSTTVNDVKVTSLSIAAPSKKLAAGKKVKLSVKVTSSNATNSAVTWQTSNTKYATIDQNGKLTLKKAGIGKTVTVTATATDGSGVKATYKIKIMKHAVKSIKLSATSKSVTAGKSIKLKATIKTTGKSVNKTLKWTSSNTKYATVTKSGKVKTKKVGKGKTVTITAVSTDGTNKKAKIKLKIK